MSKKEHPSRINSVSTVPSQDAVRARFFSEMKSRGGKVIIPVNSSGDCDAKVMTPDEAEIYLRQEAGKKS